MLPDPVTVAASSPNPELVFGVIRTDGYGSERRTVDGVYNLIIKHEAKSNGVENHYVKLSQTKDATDPYTGLTSKKTSYVAVSMNFAQTGWSITDKAALYKAIVDFIADPEVTPTKLIQFNS